VTVLAAGTAPAPPSPSARQQVTARPASAAAMITACIQSPTEPGLTMVGSSLPSGSGRADHGEVAVVTCGGPRCFLGFNCEFARLDQSPGETAIALGSRCGRGQSRVGGEVLAAVQTQTTTAQVT
jgi:hypothetical protein